MSEPRTMADTPPSMPLAVNVEEAARLLGLSRSMIYKLMTRGELRTVGIGRSRRVPVSELERLLADDAPAR